MIANIIDGRTYKIRKIVQYEEYSFSWDVNFSTTSTLTVLEDPDLTQGDFILAFDPDGQVAFRGIATGRASISNGVYTIQMKQVQNLFDRDVFAKFFGMLSSFGLEYVLAREINYEFNNTADPLVDLAYLEATPGSSTAYAKVIPTENGIYNIKTLLGNLLENDGIFTRFSFGADELTVTVEKPTFETYNLNLTGVSDVFEVDETYAIDVLAKLNVRWKIPDNETEGYVGALSYPKYYFLSTGRITQDKTDERRLTGAVDAAYIEQDTYDGMLEEVREIFRARNSYSHKIIAKIYSASKAYPWGDLEVGRPVGLKSRGRTFNSIVTGLAKQSGQPWYTVTFGALPVYLTDKLRNRRL